MRELLLAFFIAGVCISAQTPSRGWQTMQAGQQPELPPAPQPVRPRVSSPVLIYKVEPEYSEEARRAVLNALVVMQCVVGDNGLPRDIRVVRGAGFGLDEQAVAALSKWRFNPGLLNGKTPVAVATTIEMNFGIFKIDGTAGLFFGMPSGAKRPVLEKGKVPAPPEERAGTFVVRFDIDERGLVSNVQIEPGAPASWAHSIQGQIEQWAFTPATLEGAAVPVKASLALTRR